MKIATVLVKVLLQGNSLLEKRVREIDIYIFKLNPPAPFSKGERRI